jgi:putative thioredoxin
VVVDFWAPWCGPCRVLGPVLEKLALEQSSRWQLAKVNTDEHPELSAQYGIRGIPAVKLFIEGRVVDEFTGALPEYAVRQWLTKALPTEGTHRLEEARQALEQDDASTARNLLAQVLADEPANVQASALMARLLAFDAPVEAAALARAAAAEPGHVQLNDAVQTIAHLMALQQNPESLPEGLGQSAYRQALEALSRRDFDTALEHFIEVIQQDRYYDDDGARKACIALFTLLGEQHPATRKHRRMFDMSLY